MEPDPRLEAELARLARVDLEPLAARALRVAALRRLNTRRVRGRGERLEISVLVGLSAAHLLWAVLRVLELSGP